MAGVGGLAAVQRTLMGGGMEGFWRILIGDNWYTSIPLLTLMFVVGITVIGTISLTRRKARSSKDFTFSKLSGPAMKLVRRGWFRRATITLGAGLILQAVVWRDKKIGGFA